MDGGAWYAAVHGVAESWTRLSNFTFTFHFHALEKEMATHSSVLAWRIPGMGEPGRLPSMGSHRVRHDWNDLVPFLQRRKLRLRWVKGSAQGCTCRLRPCLPLCPGMEWLHSSLCWALLTRLELQFWCLILFCLFYYWCPSGYLELCPYYSCLIYLDFLFILIITNYSSCFLGDISVFS